MRAERGDQVLARDEQFRPRPGQVGVPDVERGGDRLAGLPVALGAALRAGGLQQGGALLEHPVVVGADRSVPGGHRDEQVVEEPPAVARVALDQGEVLGGEQHRAEHAEHLARPGQRRPVEPDPVGASRVQLDFHQRVIRAGGNRGPDDRLVGALADQRGILGRPVAGQGRRVAHGLDEVGLALAVRAAEDRDTRHQGHVHVHVRTEVRKREPGQVHTSEVSR